MAAGTEAAGKDPLQRMRGGLRAFLEILAEHPSESQTLLVEIIGAGPRAVPQEQDNESQPVDQVEVTKATGTVKEVDGKMELTATKLELAE